MVKKLQLELTERQAAILYNALLYFEDEQVHELAGNKSGLTYTAVSMVTDSGHFLRYRKPSELEYKHLRSLLRELWKKTWEGET